MAKKTKAEAATRATTLKIPLELSDELVRTAKNKSRSPHSIALCAVYLGLLAMTKRPEMLDVALKSIEAMREKTDAY